MAGSENKVLEPYWNSPKPLPVGASDQEPGHTGAGPLVPTTPSGLERGRYRKSKHPYYVQQAACNDEGESLLSEATGQAILEQLNKIVNILETFLKEEI